MAGKIRKLKPRVVFHRLARLYESMEESYRQTAEQIGLTCLDCPDNCCTSFFRHHTRVEWAYFLKGLDQLPGPDREDIIQKAHDYVLKAKREISLGITPEIMCPANIDGLCRLYRHRLMICRLHGVPTVHTRPDGERLVFPGCFRAQDKTGGSGDCQRLDRTGFYKELAALEQNFAGPAIARLPRVNLTLAEMIVTGPPRLSA